MAARCRAIAPRWRCFRPRPRHRHPVEQRKRLPSGLLPTVLDRALGISGGQWLDEDVLPTSPRNAAALPANPATMAGPTPSALPAGPAPGLSRTCPAPPATGQRNPPAWQREGSSGNALPVELEVLTSSARASPASQPAWPSSRPFWQPASSPPAFWQQLFWPASSQPFLWLLLRPAFFTAFFAAGFCSSLLHCFGGLASFSSGLWRQRRPSPPSSRQPSSPPAFSQRLSSPAAGFLAAGFRSFQRPWMAPRQWVQLG